MFASADRPRIDRPWIKRLALAAVAAVAIGAAALPSKPAEAQVVVGVGVPYYGPGHYRLYYSPPAGRVSRLRLGLALDSAALESLGLLGCRRLPPELVIRHRPGRVSSPATQLANTRISAGSSATMSAR